MTGIFIFGRIPSVLWIPLVAYLSFRNVVRTVQKHPRMNEFKFDADATRLQWKFTLRNQSVMSICVG